MYTLITVLTYCLDAVLITKYLDNLLKSRTTVFKYFYPALCMVELVIYFCGYISDHFNIHYGSLINIAVSMITTFLLTFFYEGRLSTKIFSAISFQVFVFISEMLCTIVVKTVDSNFLSNPDQKLVSCIMNTASEALLLMFVLLSGTFWKKRAYPSVEYSLLLYSTPTVSLMIYVVMVIEDLPRNINTHVYSAVIIGLLLLNIVNYILIDMTCKNIMVENENNDLIRQLNFQKEKYYQLNESYKQGRRIIHDIKKHYFVIKEYAAECNNEKIADYLDSAINGLESTYVRYNTGNLVIDSMLTNYENISIKNSVSFKASINVDNKLIPVKEYDLSIIIGNLLDNAINATSEGCYIKVLLSTDKDRFNISCENSISKNIMSKNDHANNDHGYGLSNVRDTVLKNYGFMSVNPGNPWIVNITIPIIR
ncbi:sensor histidine kinase [Candidatus Weimeria sp. HCP3S3_B5]|uniref:sensor histidine kinase n=1 Tax=Candidatus Weimeria sp. HCP3S3_B5 TaxID=3438871 RepID=UPI003F8978F0